MEERCAAFRIGRDDRLRLHGRELKVGSHEMPALAREKDQVPGRCFENFVAFRQPDLACTLGQIVEERHVLGSGETLPDARKAEFAAYAPRRGELGIEIHRPLEAHRLENGRQGIHGVSGKKRGVPVKTPSRAAWRLALITLSRKGLRHDSSNRNRNALRRRAPVTDVRGQLLLRRGPIHRQR